MKLLFDHHLSHKLVRRLADLFPDSTQTRLLGLGKADDPVIWEHARQHNFVIVSLDADFFDMSVMRGQPPKLVWLRCGNSTVDEIDRLLRTNFKSIEAFVADDSTQRDAWRFIEGEEFTSLASLFLPGLPLKYKIGRSTGYSSFASRAASLLLKTFKSGSRAIERVIHKIHIWQNKYSPTPASLTPSANRSPNRW